MSYPHYFKSVAHLSHIDIYRVLELYQVTDPAIAHATKKLLCAGNRGTKDLRRDLAEARDAINRKLEMMDEDLPKVPVPTHIPDLYAGTPIDQTGNKGFWHDPN